MKGYKVWTCKIIVPGNSQLPPGFDAPPRRAAIEAVENHGIDVLGCSSGWGGSLTEAEKETFEGQLEQPYPDIYFAGTLDTDDETPH